MRLSRSAHGLATSSCVTAGSMHDTDCCMTQPALQPSASDCLVCTTAQLPNTAHSSSDHCTCLLVLLGSQMCCAVTTRRGLESTTAQCVATSLQTLSTGRYETQSDVSAVLWPEHSSAAFILGLGCQALSASPVLIVGARIKYEVRHHRVPFSIGALHLNMRSCMVPLTTQCCSAGVLIRLWCAAASGAAEICLLLTTVLRNSSLPASF
jgi:hypothetical protein